MKDPREPREFSSMDDSPTNTGTFGNDRDWDEIKSSSQKNHGEDPAEDCWDEPGEDDWHDDYGERFD